MVTLAIISQVLLALAGIFLMIIVLLQRGRGGGLAGAFGGLGGQSAFGTKAGDVFTRITIVVAIIWVVLAGGSGYFLRASSEQKGGTFEGNVSTDDGTDGVGGTDVDADPPVRSADPLVVPSDPESRAEPTDGAATEPESGDGESAEVPQPDSGPAESDASTPEV